MIECVSDQLPLNSLMVSADVSGRRWQVARRLEALTMSPAFLRRRVEKMS